MTLLLYLAPTGVAFSEHGVEVGDVDVEIDLGGEKRGVAEEFLDGPDGGAVAEKMGGEAASAPFIKASSPESPLIVPAKTGLEGSVRL